MSLSPFIVLKNSAKSTCIINKKDVPLHPILLNIMSNPFISEKTLLQRWKKRGWINEKDKRNSDRHDADPGGGISHDGKACNITEASGFHSSVYIVFRVYGNTRYYEKKYI